MALPPPPLQGAAMLYDDIVRPFLLGAMKKATELPALEPYASQFLPSKVRRRGTGQCCAHAAASLPPFRCLCRAAAQPGLTWRCARLAARRRQLLG